LIYPRLLLGVIELMIRYKNDMEKEIYQMYGDI